MHFKYQIVLLGGNEVAKQELQTRIELRLGELGVDHEKHVAYLDATNFPADLIPGAPVVGVFFEGIATDPDLAFLSHLISNAYVVVPVVSDLGKYTTSVPSILHPINGFKFHGNMDELTNVCLEALNLIRRSRRLFISYRRQESSIVASQLYESLDKSGFDVFLDTIAVRPGEPFQDVLWHRLSDTDVVIILDTPGFLDSRWTQEELAKASAMSIGLLQLVWPNHVPIPRSALCEKFYLDSTMNFSSYNDSKTDHPLSESTIDQITAAVESLRARSFAARYDNLVKELKKAADDTGCLIAVQPDRHVFVSKLTGKVTATVPAVGVPDAISYHAIDQFYTNRPNPEIIGTILLYDHRNIRETWCQHLSWLDKHLPVSSLRITEVTKWLQTL